MPNEQRQMGYMMMIISPIMIVWISLSSASALGLYWSVSAAFLIVQTQLANMYYSKLAKKEVANDIMHSPPSAIKHFYDKLFKLKDLMHTPTAKKLAEERHIYMENFVKQFFQEWYF